MKSLAPNDAVDQKMVSIYRDAFTSLNRNKKRELGESPHKPILLLTVIDAIESGRLRSNDIKPSEAFYGSYKDQWANLRVNPQWQINMVYPFWHLAHDGFWHLNYNGNVVGVNDVERPKSLKALRLVIDSAVLDDPLWTLLQNSQTRSELSAVLRRVI